MAQVDTSTASTTTSGGGGNAFGFNGGVPDDESVPGLPADGERAADGLGDGETAAPSAEQVAAEGEAARSGWMSRADWVADGRNPERWRPASEFLEVRRGISTVVKEENAGLRAKLASLEAKLQERDRKEAEAQGKFTRETLKLELKQARENQDWDRVDELTEKFLDAKLSEPKAPPAQTMPPEMRATLEEFGAENKWLQTDPELKVDFTVYLKGIIDTGAVADLSEALKHAKRRVMRENPDKFRTPARRTAMVETGGSSGSSTNGRTWSDLKPDYRKTAEKDIERGKYSKDDYLANCDSEAFRR